MKKWLIMLVMIPAMAGATTVWGGPGDRITGSASGDTLIDTLQVTVIIPARIGLYVNGDVTFDLSTVAYPPAAFPGYYDPTSVSGTNADGVDVQVFSNDPSTTWHLETMGSGDFSATVTLDQLLYAPDGTANPADGAAAPASWTSFSTTSTEIVSNAGKTNGWLSEDQDYVFEAQTDDEPIAAGATITIYYRLYAQ